ncbi:MAG: GTP-binding protein [Stictis urceolatum]|nr:GTP-binding protein [Stictis urceolata]
MKAIGGKDTRISPSQLAFHWETTPSSRINRRYAEAWFTKHAPVKLFIAGELYQVPYTSIPEVAFFGRSNVGKSSLLNAIMDSKICHTSANPGRTRTMNAYAIGGPGSGGNKGRITILDMPGYGKGSRGEWGTQIQKYLAQRKELKRVFFMMDPLHGLKDSDRVFLELLRSSAIPHQIIISKVDRVLLPAERTKKLAPSTLEHGFGELKQLMQNLKAEVQPKNEGPPALGEILACSTDLGRWREVSPEPRGQMGINAIRWAILVAAGLTNKKTQPLEILDPLKTTRRDSENLVSRNPTKYSV